MVRRSNPDPLLLQTVSQRLARLLAENEPQPSDGPGATPAPSPPQSAVPVAGFPAVDGAAEELPEPRRRFERAHLGVVAVLLLLGLLAAGWSVVRARPVALAAPAVVPSAVVTEAAPARSGVTPGVGTPSPSPGLVVHVLGAVRSPGLVRLPAPARVQDAVDAAGGFTRAADPGELNLAQLLTDGQQVLIGNRGQPDGQVRGSAGGRASDGQPRGPGSVDLNTADVAQLDELPGVGPVTAAKILAWRDQHGRFARVEELQEVDGIGPKTYAEIAPHVRV